MNQKLMGVLNVTPDSFSDGGKYHVVEKAIQRGVEMAHQGADIIDIGGESTRPKSDPVPVEEELRRVIPVITELTKEIDVPISIDTMKPEVARASLEAGASYLNDVSGFRDDQMVAIAAEYGVEIFCMHMLGVPKTMQADPFYEEGVIRHLQAWIESTAQRLIDAGIKREKIIFDPGIGFGKTVAHNLQIIHNLHELRTIGYPILVGASRKSFMTKILGKPPRELGAATVAMHTAALLNGADYIRVHDVTEHRDVIDVIRCFQAQEYPCDSLVT